MIKLIVGVILGLLIDAGCRWFDIPVPSPPKLGGVMLVVAMTIGYLLTDKIIVIRFSTKGPASSQHLCGGPTGSVISSPSS